MGRLKKYKTEQERIEAQRAWAKEYYHRNKEVINKKTMEKYYELRKYIQPDSGKSEE
jgi:hypothetical protein